MFSAPLSPVIRPLSLLAATLLVCAAPAFFVLEHVGLGAALLGAGLACAWLADQSREPGPASAPSLTRDLLLIGLGLSIVRTISLEAALDTWSMIRFTLALGGAVVVPYALSRFGSKDRAISFPWRGGVVWQRWQWIWLGAVVILGVLLLPFYFISSGVYLNWPKVDTADLIVRLFIGVGAVGIWDELFFICTVLVLLMRHFPFWLANLLQCVVFVSFLWELGYQAWGPILTIPFALVQGLIFVRSRSLAYVVTVHLLFDAVVFAVLVYAHNT